MLSELMLDLGKCFNQKTYESESAQFGHLTRSKIVYKSIFFLTYWQLFFKNWQHFVSNNCVPKIGLSIWFSKRHLTLVRFIFGKKTNSEKVKQSGICPSFYGNMPEAQIWKVPFRDPFYLWVRVRECEFTGLSSF